MRLHALQHVPYEPPGRIAGWAHRRGHTMHTSHLYAGDPLPAPGAFDWLIVMGGPMGVGDEHAHPWLAPEKDCIARAVHDGALVIGICLGAQLLAQVLGARVFANPEEEIGWFPLRPAAGAAQATAFADWPDRPLVLHWHGDTFELPAGAVHAWSSDACTNQAFVVKDRLYGLQFHVEVTPEGCAALCDACADKLQPSPWRQDRATLLGDAARFTAAHAWLEAMLDRIAGGAAT
jgi:GMP synthase-like glutamine amidotransferase